MNKREENMERTRAALAGKRFICSYSGGKDSTLALYRAVLAGGEPQAVFMTYNEDAGRTWFHGVPEDVVRRAQQALGIPVRILRTPGERYAERLEEELRLQRAEGAAACVFGDIDLAEHLAWCTERCENAGMRRCFSPVAGNAGIARI